MNEYKIWETTNSKGERITFELEDYVYDDSEYTSKSFYMVIDILQNGKSVGGLSLTFEFCSLFDMHWEFEDEGVNYDGTSGPNYRPILPETNFQLEDKWILDANCDEIPLQKLLENIGLADNRQEFDRILNEIICYANKKGGEDIYNMFYYDENGHGYCDDGYYDHDYDDYYDD